MVIKIVRLCDNGGYYMIVQCEYCSKEIDKDINDIKAYKHHFCNKECHGRWRAINEKIMKNCIVCNKEFIVNKAREKTAKFCSKECHHKFQNKKIKTNCTNCGKEVHIKPSKLLEHNFCCNKCVGEWNGRQRSNKMTKECAVCHKTYEVVPSRKNSVTCSRECQGKWFSETVGSNPDYIEFRRKVSFKNIEKQRYKSTKPERMVENYLVENNIEFIPQVLFYNKYTVDFYLPKDNIIIEVQGDYWHGNPKSFGDEDGKKPLTKRQKTQSKKDKGRYSNLKLRGHLIYFVWESDIYRDINESLSFLN